MGPDLWAGGNGTSRVGVASRGGHAGGLQNLSAEAGFTCHSVVAKVRLVWGWEVLLGRKLWDAGPSQCWRPLILRLESPFATLSLRRA